MIPSSRCLALSISAVMFVSVMANGQGIRMAPDFLPLDVGNLWRYEVADGEGNLVGSIEYEVNEYSIVDGVSFYVFNHFPLAPDLAPNQPVAIRFDGDLRQFIWFDGENQEDLFPSLGASAEVLETDDNGLPFRALFRFGAMVLTLERGVGIIQAGFQTSDGPRVANLVAARVGGSVVGTAPREPGPGVREPVPSTEPVPVADPIDTVAKPDEVQPQLIVEVAAERDVHRFVLRVRNPSQQLLPFDFTSSQDVDFVVVDPLRGQEIWRWSQRRFFSQVVRSVAIRPGGEWEFEGEWSHRDSNLNEVEPGPYEVFGILAAQNPIESESVRFEVD
jgi:hypothetical protein